ncbi:MAG: hypothetical protein HFACDABA_00832 [Anaerolineales bacterium]|nr:hypothetical protein [Anaerolineales bacterium]
MDITCWSCKTVTKLENTGIVDAIQKMDAVKLGFYDVPCTKCGKKNRTQRSAFMDGLASAKAAPEVIAQAQAAAPAPSVAKNKVKVTVASLRVREEHNTHCDVVGGLVKDQEVDVFETWSDGKDTWVRIGEGMWAAMEWNGQKMMEQR